MARRREPPQPPTPPPTPPTPPTPPPGDRFIDRKEVLARSGLSYPQVVALERSGNFPRGRRVSARRTLWLNSEFEAWQKSRPIRLLEGEAAE